MRIIRLFVELIIEFVLNILYIVSTFCRNPQMSSYGTTEESASLLKTTTPLTAHTAFKERDVEASRLFHEQRRAGAINVENHGDINASELKSAVYGGLDGKYQSMFHINYSL